MIEVFKLMLTAKNVTQYSNCGKRKIACVVPVGGDEIWGYNNVLQKCAVCSRETCGAIHAEQAAVAQLIYLKEAHNATKMYLWAEPPCMQCLNFIRRYTAISIIYCLSPESYKTEYPIVARRSEEILCRRMYAKSLGISIIELDREEIIEYDLSKHSETNIRPDKI